MKRFFGWFVRHSNAIKIGMITGLLVGNFIALAKLSAIQNDFKRQQTLNEEAAQKAVGQVIDNQNANAARLGRIIGLQKNEIKYLECLLRAHNLGDFDHNTCRQQVKPFSTRSSPTTQTSPGPGSSKSKGTSKGGGGVPPPEPPACTLRIPLTDVCIIN